MNPVRAIDVSTYLRSRGVVSGWVCQKLAYYCQAWSLAWDGSALFGDDFEAWRDGPVCRDIREHGSEGDSTRLAAEQIALIDQVLDFYGTKPKEWLIELTHREPPWVEARGALSPGEHGQEVISKDAIRAYFSSMGVSRDGFTREFMIALEVLVDTPPNVPSLDDDKPVPADKFLKWLDSAADTKWATSVN